MRAHFLTDRLFDGTALHTGRLLRLTVDGNRISYVGDHASGPPVSAEEVVADLRGRCLLPGLIDVHVHLSYGNAEANEDMDIYAPTAVQVSRDPAGGSCDFLGILDEIGQG